MPTMKRVFTLSIKTLPRRSEHEPEPGPQYTTEAMAIEMGKRFLAEVSPFNVGWDLAVDVAYYDVDMREQEVHVEIGADEAPPALGDMHHAAVAIVEEGGAATYVDVAARLHWFEKTRGGIYRTGRLDLRRAEAACIAGVEHEIIGVDGDLYTAAVEDR
jgi:hypothetical protein